MKSLGLYTSQLHSEYNVKTLVERDTKMNDEMIRFFKEHPEIDYLTVVVGRAHVPGMMKSLYENYGFQNIPLRLKKAFAK